jgi:phosphoenolpyruvate carboxykinase (GTP)
MLIPPASMQGYEITTLGDDIAWIRFGEDGRLWAVNPEAGFFGVAPGTGARTNPNALATISKNTIFTNVALTADGRPWWEGLSEPPPGLIDWTGKPWDPASGSKAAHPNSRFTTPARQCPTISPRFDDPAGVPLSAIIFGGRRARLAPLVYETFSWQHGVYAGASMASETTAAATGAVGVVRRDPMAMRPFCGYHIGDYFQHWLDMAAPRPGQTKRMPRIFHVNWFRTDAQGRYLWPGFGDNLRVLRWMIDRVAGRAKAAESPIGYLPAPGAIDLSGLNIAENDWRELFAVDRQAWTEDANEIGEFFAEIGDRLPPALERERQALLTRLK